MKLAETITVENPLGLHLRAAAQLAVLSARFKSSILIRKGSVRVNGKSVINLLGLAASCGTVLEIILEGDDAEQALMDIRIFFKDRLKQLKIN